ncbi:MAG TPA: glutaminase, partial [Pseudomonadales bacterium]
MPMQRTPITQLIVPALLMLLAGGANAADPLSKSAVDAALRAAYASYAGLHEGKNADYIPALAKVDPNLFGIVLVTTDGKVY